MAVECDEWCSCSNVSITNIIGFGRLLCVCVWKKKEKKNTLKWMALCMCYCCRYSIFGWLFILCKRFVQCDSFIYRHHLQKGRLRWMPVFKFRNRNDSCSFPIFIIFYFSDVSTLWKKKKRVELVTGTVATNTDRNEAYIPKKKKKPEVSALYT